MVQAEVLPPPLPPITIQALQHRPVAKNGNPAISGIQTCQGCTCGHQESSTKQQELQRMHDFYIDGVAPPSVCEAAMHPDDRTVIDRYLRMRMPDFYK